MNVTFATERPGGSYALAIPVWSDDLLADRLRGLPEPSRTLAARAAEAQRFERDAASVVETFIDEGEGVRRLLFVGLGARRDDEILFEKAGGALSAKLLKSGESTLVIDLTGLDLGGEGAARFAFGAAVRAWQYDIYRTKLAKKAKPTLTNVVIVSEDAQAADRWAAKQALLDGISLTRELVTEPANVVFPVSFVERCRASIEGLGIEIEVLDEQQMAELGMNALLGVAQGSVQPPRLLALRWNGAADPAASPVVFVGKGVTFDTGGISIKPAAGLIEMPPVSKVTPLPTKATGFCFASAPFHCMVTSWLSRALPWPTPSKAPMPSLVISLTPSTFTSTPSSDSDRASLASVSG
jgi:leucyl aminopeptidase